MPKRARLDSLSGSDTDGDGEASALDRGGKPGKHAADPKSPPLRKDSEVFLRSLLGSSCGCKAKRKSCLKQFVDAPDDFKKLAQYRCYWFELHKTDQDNYALTSESAFVFDAGSHGP